MIESRAGSSLLPPLQILAAPDPPLRDEPPGPVGQRWLDCDGRLVASAGTDGASWWMHWPSLGVYRFGRKGPVRATPAREDASEQLRDSYLRGVAPVVLLARGYEAFHASAVADARGVVMLCAVSSTGKSTTAAAMSGHGLELWADDTVLYRVCHGRPVAVRLPFTSRLDDPARSAVRSTTEPGFARSATERTLRRAYVLTRDPTLDPKRPVITPIPAPARVERVLAHAHPFELGGDDRRRAWLEAVLTVARMVDIWECRFAPSLDHVPVLADVLSRHAEAAA